MSMPATSEAGLSPVSDPAPALYPQFILLGDSITQNSTISLQAYLATQYTRRFDVINRGFSGYTAPLGLCAIRKFLPKQLFMAPPSSSFVPEIKLLALWYGANDACAPGGAGNQHVPLDEYVASLEAITRYSVLEAQKTAIVILTPPPVDEHQFDDVNPRTAARTADYAIACRQLAQRLGLPLVDVWELFMAEAGYHPLPRAHASTQQNVALPGSKAAPSSSAFKELLWDGLHLSTKGYRIVFEELMKVIRRDLPVLAPENLPLTIFNNGPDFPYERLVADQQLCQDGYPTQDLDRERVERSRKELELLLTT